MTDKTPARTKGTRTAKPVYAVMQVKDNNDNPIPLTKENVEILGVYKDADALLTILDNDELPDGAFYKRIALA